MMINTEKYLEAEYKFNGRTVEEGLDCLGLLLLIYSDMGWNVPSDPLQWDGKPIENDWHIKDPFRLYRYLLDNWDKEDDIKNLEEGDILLWVINGESHVGTYLGYGKFISTFPKISIGLPFSLGGYVFCDRLSRFNSIKNIHFRCGFKRRK